MSIFDLLRRRYIHGRIDKETYDRLESKARVWYELAKIGGVING